MGRVMEDDDVIGTVERGQPRVVAKKSPQDSAHLVEDLLRGVTVTWLSQVFRIDRKTVRQRLKNCPVLSEKKLGNLYDLREAARYLVVPAMQAEQFLKTMKPSELPAHLQQTYWDAALKRQKWEENARQLWRTEQVVDVLGSTFLAIKNAITLWPDTVEQTTGTTPAQRDLLTTLCDKLQADIYEALVEQTRKHDTRAQIAELDAMIPEGYEVPEPASAEEYDDVL